MNHPKNHDDEIAFLKRRILHFAKLIETEQDEGFKAAYEEAIESFFNRIAYIEVHKASQQALSH